jgi:hypothetical protein
MKTKILLSGLMLLAASFAFGTYVPLTVTSGFNADVIANGVGSAASTTTNDVDGVNYCYVSNGWQLNSSSTPLTTGLPATGLVNSAVTSGLTFQLASYSSDNDLRLASNTASTLTFQTPTAAQNLYVLAVTGSGSSVMTVTINFTDLSSQVNPSITVSDWYGGTSVALTGFQRLNRTNNVLDNGTNGPNLYQYTIPILALNQNKLISSITITRLSGSGLSTTLNVFAATVEASVVVSCPQPSTLTATAITSAAATLGWTESGSATQWQMEYGTSGFTQGGGTSLYTTTNPKNIAGLSSATTYDFYVRAICGAGDTSAWSGPFSFTTNCSAPNLLSTTPASHCGPGSVTLNATADPGATINWYSAATGGISLGTGNAFSTPSLTTTTTYYAGASAGSVSSGVVKITEMGVGGPDALEIQNVGSAAIDVTGWRLAVSNSYGSITSVNSNIQTLSGIMAPNDIHYWTDQSGTNYWGSNILWNPGSYPTFTGWAILLDNNNNVVDFVAYNWPVSTIQSTTLTIGSTSISLATAWSGVPLDATPTSLGSTTSFQRTGSTDNDVATDFSVVTSTMGSTNTGLNLPWGGAACESPRQAVIATIYDLPAPDLGNDTTICPGVTEVLDAGSPGSTYLWSTNETSQTINVSASGVFFVTVTSGNGCVGSDTVAITPGFQPVNNLPAVSNLCAGTTITLNAGNAGCAYIWNTTETTQNIDVSSSGIYTVDITSPDNCVLHSSTDVVDRALPVVDLGNDTAICPTDVLVLNAGNAGNTFLWNTGATTQTVTTVDSGTYSVLVTNMYDCEAGDEKHIAFLSQPFAEGFNFIPLFYDEIGKVSFSMLNPRDVVTCQWDFGDGSPFSTDLAPTHIYASGNYLVTLTVFNGCGQYSVSLLIHVDTATGIAEVLNRNGAISLYPNPTRNQVIIENKTGFAGKQLIVMDALGRIVYQKMNVQDKELMDVSGFASGLYAVRLLTKAGWSIGRFEVQK